MVVTTTFKLGQRKPSFNRPTAGPEKAKRMLDRIAKVKSTISKVRTGVSKGASAAFTNIKKQHPAYASSSRPMMVPPIHALPYKLNAAFKTRK